MDTIYANAQDAFLGQLNRVMTLGHPVARRTDPTLELVGEAFVINDPLQRCIVTAHRNNSIAAAVAESMWMISGRDDVAFLLPYLPRAARFSDDGVTWRAAYGPRLRGSFGVDQLARVRELLIRDPQTRRAVATLFDPASDFVDTRDVPCNNWLHFLVVDGSLDLLITARSIDLVWGFSGTDAFQWSVLQEMMARWLELPVGRQHWFISSCHLYMKHHERASRMLAAAESALPDRTRFAYAGRWENLSNDLEDWFTVESRLRSGESVTCTEIQSRISEPLLQSFAVCVAGFWDLQSDRSLEQRLSWLSDSDLAPALDQWAAWSRRRPELLP